MSLLGTIGVKLCPLPAMRMRWLPLALRTMSCSAVTLVGRCNTAGRASTLPAQFRQRRIVLVLCGKEFAHEWLEVLEWRTHKIRVERRRVVLDAEFFGVVKIW